MVADQVSHLAHLNARDTTLAFASTCAAGRHQAAQDADGLGLHPLVHHLRTNLRRRLRRDQWHGHNAFIRDGDRIEQYAVTKQIGTDQLLDVIAVADERVVAVPRSTPKSASETVETVYQGCDPTYLR